jgi:hypothetical protein
LFSSFAHLGIALYSFGGLPPGRQVLLVGGGDEAATTDK